MYAAAGGASLARSRAARAQHKKAGGDGHRSNRHQNNNPTALTFNRPVTPCPPPPPPVAVAAAEHHHHQRHHRLLSLDKPPSYAELNGRITSFGSNDLISEGQGGKAAWQDRERRLSVAEVAVNHRIKATEAHRRWMKRNRIHDSSFGGSSSDEDIPGGLYGHQSAAANALLYVGLGTVAIGFVIFFVGTGEKGFKTLQLRLIGPTLICSGFLCCIIRVLLCVCPSRCLRRRRKHRHRHKHQGNSLRHYDEHGELQETVVEEIQLADHASLIRKPSKKSAAPPPAPPILATTLALPSSSSQDQYPIIASTTAFLKNEKERNNSCFQIPTINIPNFVSSVSDDDDISVLQQALHDTSPAGTYDLLEYELQQMDNLEYEFDREFGSFVGSGSSKESGHKNHLSASSARDSGQGGSKDYGGNSSRDRGASGNRDFLGDYLTRDYSGIGANDYRTNKDYLQIESELRSPVRLTSTISYRDSKITKPRAPANTARVSSASAASASKREDGVHRPALKRCGSVTGHRDLDDLLKPEIVLSPSKLQQHVREQ